MTKIIELIVSFCLVSLLGTHALCKSDCFQEIPNRQEKSAAEVLEYILAQRRKITFGHVNTKSKYTNFGSRFTSQSETFAWFQGEKLRVDKRFIDGDKGLEQMPDSVCLFGFEGMHVHYGLGLHDAGILLVSDPKTTKLRESPWLISDPRFLGLIPDSWLSSGVYNETTYFKPDESGCSIESVGEKYKNLDVSVLTFKNEGNSISIKYVKELDCAVLSAKSVHRSGLMVNEIVNELGELPEQKIWYPISTAFVSILNNVPSRTEELTVEADFSTKLDDKVFSISGMEFVKPGTVVNWHGPIREDKMHPLEWNGKDIIHVEKDGKKNEIDLNRVDSDSLNLSGMFFIAGAFLLGIGAAVILWKARKKAEVSVK